jgi:hypothetical protein
MIIAEINSNSTVFETLGSSSFHFHLIHDGNLLKPMLLKNSVLTSYSFLDSCLEYHRWSRLQRAWIVVEIRPVDLFGSGLPSLSNSLFKYFTSVATGLGLMGNERVYPDVLIKFMPEKNRKADEFATSVHCTYDCSISLSAVCSTASESRTLTAEATDIFRECFLLQ